MRIAVAVLCLGATLLWGARTFPEEPQIERAGKPPAAVDRTQTGEVIERQGNTGDIFRHREAAATRYSTHKPQLERSAQPRSPAGLPQDPARENPAVEENPDRVYQDLLAKGWSLYQEGDYLKAMQEFAGAGKSGEPDTRLQSELGIAYSLMQQGEKQKAIDYLTSLVARGYRLQTTSEALVPLLVETDRLDEARNLLGNLPEPRRFTLQEQIDRKILQRGIEEALAADDLARLSRTVQGALSRVKSCQDSEYFYQAAVAMSRLGNTSDAVDLLQDLTKCRTEDREWQIRLLTQRLSELEDIELIEALRFYSGSELYGPDLLQAGQGLVWQRLDRLGENDPGRQSLIETLLLLDPEDRRIMSMLAWSCYQRTEYECSERYFRQLFNADNSDSDALEGLCLTLVKTGAPLEAVTVIESFAGQPDEKIERLLADLYALLGKQDYDNGNYSSAAGYLDAAVQYDPARRDLLGLLHWSRYRLGETDGLVGFLMEEYEKNPAPQTARTYLDILRETGQGEKRELFVNDLAQSSNQELRRLAAEEYYARGWEMRAASTYDAGDTCYSGCNKPGFDSTVSIRMRNGDEGTSRLDAIAYSGELQLQASRGRRWNFGLTPLYLSSGNAAEHPYVGSYYHSLVEPGRTFKDLTTDYTVLRPDLRLVQEGERSWQLQAGTTPVGGTVDPLPTFSATIRDRQWYLKLVQESVRESILSWVGIDDPYSGREWGRVVRTGLTIRRTIELEGPWWLSADGEYHFYWGENVIDNQRLSASLSWGRTDPWHDLSRTFGLFAGISGFEHNVNFFTYGHGGYYSPQLMFLAGPFVRLTAKNCGRFWWDAQLSMGYSYRRTENAPHYRKINNYVPGLSTDADNDIAQMYEGSSESQLTVDGRLRGLYHLGGSWFLGAEAGINNSSDFTELQAGLFLRYRFGKGSALCVSAAQANNSFVPIR